ncbi:unnamed protein product [Pseudo-nitzschia multistriata]|uniref:Uncharacterized protein n=1 Tax=Pseudo-nitzschia multistriata TaxID=183589 RepID=A0A448Z509_9STRA|nr:unnamed protein product [Pseudo-nitzschia multistriata]
MVEASWVVDSLFDVLLEVAQQSLDGPCGGISKGANGLSLDLPSNFLEHRDLALVCVSLLHPDENVLQPRGSLAARGTLTAGFVLVKVREPSNRGDHVDGIVKHGNGRSSERGSKGLEVVEFHQRLVTKLLVHCRRRGSTGDTGLQGIPPVPHATTVLLDKFLQGNAHGFFHDRWILDVAGNTEKLGAAVVFISKPGKPRGTTPKNGWRDSDRLDIRDCGWAPKNANSGWKWGLEAGLSLPSLERLN